VKGGFQNVREEDVIKQVEKSEEGRKWIPYIPDFFRARQFEVEWDGIVRGRGRTNVGALEGSRLSPVIFPIWMAPIIEKMEQEARRVWPTLEMELPSYVDDLHLEVHTTTREEGKGLDMMTVLNSVDGIINRVALENHLPLEESKHEKLVLRDRKRKKKAEVKWVKWLGIILDESLTFEKHWRSCIAKAQAMLAQINGIGNSQLGVSASN